MNIYNLSLVCINISLYKEKNDTYKKLQERWYIPDSRNIRTSEKYLSFYKEIMDAHFPFYIILSNYVWSILFYQNKDHNARQIRFHVRIKMRRCNRRA